MRGSHVPGWNTSVAGEGNERCFVADEVVENASKECRVAGSGAQHLRSDAGKGEKTAKRLGFGGKPGEGVDGQHFRGVEPENLSFLHHRICLSEMNRF